MRTRARFDILLPVLLLGLLVLAGLGFAIAMGAGTMLLALAAALLFLAWVATSVESRYFAVMALVLLLLAPWQHLGTLAENPLYFPVLWAVVALVVIVVARNGLTRLDGRVLFGFILVAGWATLGFVLGHGELGRLAVWVIFWGLGFFVYLLLSVPGALLQVVRGSWLIGALLGGYAIVEWLLRMNILFGGVVEGLWDVSFYASETYRLTTTVGHPIVAGAVLGFFITILAWAWTRGLLPSVPVAVGLIPCAVALVLTGSRGSLIVTTIAVAIAIAVPGGSTRRRGLLLAGIILAFVVVVALVPTAMESRFSDIARDPSFLQRTKGLAAAQAIVGDEPLWGRGAGYGDLALRDLGYIETNYESEYAGLLIGLGIPGALFVLLLPLVAMVRTPGGRVRLALVVAPFAAYAVGFLGPANMFEWWGGTILFWATIGFVSWGDELVAKTPEPA